MVEKSLVVYNKGALPTRFTLSLQNEPSPTSDETASYGSLVLSIIARNFCGLYFSELTIPRLTLYTLDKDCIISNL